MTTGPARALLRVERLGDVCPELREAYRDGSLSWVQAQALAPLIESDDEGDWRGAWVRFAATGDPVYCVLWTLCGVPTVSLPLLRGENGLPIGVQTDLGRRARRQLVEQCLLRH